MSEFITYPGCATSSASTSLDASSSLDASPLSPTSPASPTEKLPADLTFTPLHRWTSLPQLITFTAVPASQVKRDSPISLYSRQRDDDEDDYLDPSVPCRPGSGIVDINTTKLLSSAFAIALSNTGCTLPVFIQTGQPWKLLFHGIQISLIDASADGSVAFGVYEFEQRFKTTFLPYVPPTCNSLAALCAMFRDRLGIMGVNASPSTDVAKQVFASVATRYIYIFHPDGTNRESRRLPVEHMYSPSMPLPIGQIADPIVRLILETHYPIAPVESYIDVLIDPALSPLWSISFLASPTSRYLSLSQALKTAVAGWSEVAPDDNSIEAVATEQLSIPGAFSSGSGFNNSRSLGDGQRQRLIDHRDIMDTVRYILNNAEIVPRFQRSTTAIPTPHVTPSASLATSVTADASASASASASAAGDAAKSHESRALPIHLTNQLISKLQYQSATVPINSPLWHLCVRLLDACLARPRFLRFDAGIIALLKGVWEEFIVELNQLWDLATDAIASLDSIIEDVRKIELDLCYAVSILRKTIRPAVADESGATTRAGGASNASKRGRLYAMITDTEFRLVESIWEMR
eukprot:jgi/Hompol1/4319/HPOL_001573-RA